MLNTGGPSALGEAETRPEVLRRRWESVREALVQDGLFDLQQGPPWRLSPFPFSLTPFELEFFETLGTHLLTFYRSLNRLYLDSVRGSQPSWISAYLDQGKPEDLIAYARMKRFRDVLPDVIRPDIIPTDSGMVITELDSVPGGMGITGALSHAYASFGDEIVGGRNGMVEAFAGMIRSRMNDPNGCVAIVVSDEAEDYRSEMQWMAAQLPTQHLDASCIHPREIRFTEEGLFLSAASGERPISVLYRFFELFDLKNIPKAELMMYAAKKGRVVVTPPYKPWMEEKLAFALLHHPLLKPFWIHAMGLETFDVLVKLIPHTWVLDPRPVPPSAVIPHLEFDGHAVSDWRDLTHATQRQRQYVIKPSGFSELAWGSRGVSVGHDLPQGEWGDALDHALGSFSTTPYILQEFHKGKIYDLLYVEEDSHHVVSMAGRARLSPYYLVQDGQAKLAGILATVCPKDKKIIHGMRDAIMAPCSVSSPS